MMLGVTITNLGEVAALRCEGRIVAGDEATALRNAVMSQGSKQTLTKAALAGSQTSTTWCSWTVERNPWAAIKFCREIVKVASPRQQVALLIGYSAPATTVSDVTLIPKDEDPKYSVDRISRLLREVA